VAVAGPARVALTSHHGGQKLKLDLSIKIEPAYAKMPLDH
jgi:hypothetical protein